MRMEKSEKRPHRHAAPLLFLTSLALGTGGIAGTRLLYDRNPTRLQSCLTIEEVNSYRVLTYDKSKECTRYAEDRGKGLRETGRHKESIQPKPVSVPPEYQDLLSKEDFLMVRQSGGTCYLTAVVASLSDLGCERPYDFVDPFAASDLAYSQSVDGVRYRVDTVDNLNFKNSVAKGLERTFPSSGNDIAIDEIDISDIEPEISTSSDLANVLEFHLADPNTHVLLTSFVRTRPDKKYDASHTVVLLGQGIDPYTGDQILIAAEPNGGVVDGYWDMVDDYWEALGERGDFAIKIPIEPAMEHIRSITLIQRNPNPHDVSP